MFAPPGQRPASAADAEALFAEARGAARTSERALFEAARRRRRRRWLAGAAALLVLVTAGLALAAALRPHRPTPSASAPGTPGTLGAAAGRGKSGAPLVAWVDSAWGLHLGSLATRTQRVVATAYADLGTPLVQAGGAIYWVNTGGTYVPELGSWSQYIQRLDLATGQVTTFGPGQRIFLSADGRQLYLSQMDNQSLIERPVGRGRLRRLTLPAGWYLPGGISAAVAGGIVVQSQSELGLGRVPPVLGIWHPGTGQVTALGRAVGADWGAVVGAYTPPGGRYSLLAWMPACRFPVHCAIRITNTVTLASRTLHSPLPYGFALGGAFSPDGRQLVLIANRDPGTGGGAAEPVIVSTRTWAMRPVPRARLQIGEDIAWARWLPGGRQLLAGSDGSDYVVTAPTLAAQPLTFRGAGQESVGYSAVVIPPR